MNFSTKPSLLLVGEISVDVTLMANGQEDKLRLGGIVHAARGLWSIGQPFAIAAILPSYLRNAARDYLMTLGCTAFLEIGEVEGAPNITLIRDASEVADQGYQTLLREEKQVNLTGITISGYRDVLVFPGSYNLQEVCSLLPREAVLHLDVAYDLEDPAALGELPRPVETVFISTSSELFTRLWKGSLKDFSKPFLQSGASNFILKENRGGSRLVRSGTTDILSLPAQLGSTINSVGVGDVFAAVYVASMHTRPEEAAWRGTYAAAAYSQTTYPDIFKNNVQRDLHLSLEELEGLGGVILPWEERQQVSIYFAAPDFSYIDRFHIDRAINALTYHNFVVRRPVLENGELPKGSAQSTLRCTFEADYSLLLACDLIFALPLERDPGTLVEIGIAVEAGIPVVVFDPKKQNDNTMVMAGARHYSDDLDLCLNSTFRLLSQKRSS